MSKTAKIYSLEGKRVFVAGHRGMVGSAIFRRLKREATLLTPQGDRLDLRRQSLVEKWFEAQRPQVVILAAAKVGGIAANASQPAKFIYDNIAIQTNVIEAARRTGGRRKAPLPWFVMHLPATYAPTTGERGGLADGSP